jgi:hypothetical protein
MSGIESIRDQICSAFCNQIAVRRVPVGLAISTDFQSLSGDHLGFYVVRSSRDHEQFRLEDSGTIVPMLEADGVNLHKGTRADFFRSLLASYNAEFDDNSRTLQTPYMSADELASSSLRFLALLLRMQDLEALHPTLVANTFAEDARKAIQSKFKDRADVTLDDYVSEDLADYVVDAIIRPQNFNPVAVYFATNQSRVDEAVILKMDSKTKNPSLKVVLLLETAVRSRARITFWMACLFSRIGTSRWSA